MLMLPVLKKRPLRLSSDNVLHTNWRCSLNYDRIWNLSDKATFPQFSSKCWRVEVALFVWCFGKSQEIGSKGEGGCLHPLTDNWHALWSHQLTFNFLTMVMTISCLTIMIFRTRCDVNTLTSFRLGFLSVLCPNSLSPEITSGFPSVPFVCMHCDL